MKKMNVDWVKSLWNGNEKSKNGSGAFGHFFQASRTDEQIAQKLTQRTYYNG